MASRSASSRYQGSKETLQTLNELDRLFDQAQRCVTEWDENYQRLKKYPWARTGTGRSGSQAASSGLRERLEKLRTDKIEVLRDVCSGKVDVEIDVEEELYKANVELQEITSEALAGSSEWNDDYLLTKGSCSFKSITVSSTSARSTLDVQLLDNATKARMFKLELPLQSSDTLRARDIADELGRLSPDIARSFQIKSSTADAMAFRILREPGTDPATAESYIALSYCWSSPNSTAQAPNAHSGSKTWFKSSKKGLGGPKQESKVSLTVPQTKMGKDLPLSPLIAHALLAERKSSTEGIWIDAICINQKDDAEKLVAIPSMDVVYKCPRSVVICLEDIEVSEEEELCIKKYIGEFEAAGEFIVEHPFETLDPPVLKTNKILLGFFRKLVCAKWFTRAWCAHEVRLGRRHVFLVACQSKSKGSAQVLRFTGLFLYHLATLFTVPEVRDSVWEDYPDVLTKEVGLLGRLTNSMQGLLGQNEFPDLQVVTTAESLTSLFIRQMLNRSLYGGALSILFDAFKHGCGGNPDLPPKLRACDANRDRLCIALNTAGLGLSLTGTFGHLGTYQATEEECWRHFLLLALATGNAEVLGASGPPLNLGKAVNTRSWLCQPDGAEGSFGKDLQFTASEISVDPGPMTEYIELSLSHLDTTVLYQPTELHVQLAATLLRDYVTCEDWVTVFPFTHFPFESRLKPGFQSALASALDCGPQWMAESWLSINSTEAKSYSESLRIAVQNLIVGQPNSLTHEEVNLLLRFMRALLQELDNPFNDSIFSENSNSTLKPPNVLKNGLGGNMMVPSSPGAGWILIVPTVLLDNKFQTLNRAWIIKKAAPGRKIQGSYHLGGKSKTFGNVSAADSGLQEVRDLGRVRVYGPKEKKLDRFFEKKIKASAVI